MGWATDVLKVLVTVGMTVGMTVGLPRVGGTTRVVYGPVPRGQSGTAPPMDMINQATTTTKEAQSQRAPIDAIVYINLDRRTERRERMEGLLAKMDFDSARKHKPMIPHHRFAAVETSWTDVQMSLMQNNIGSQYYGLLPVDTTVAGYLSDESREKKRSFAVSCLVSHLNVWRNINEGKYGQGNVLVLEDDPTMADGWQEVVASAVSNVPSDWDIMCFDTWGTVQDKDKIFSNDELDIYRRPDTPPGGLDHPVGVVGGGETRMPYGGTHACMVRQSTAANLLQGIHEAKMLADLDVHLSNKQIHSYFVQSKSGVFQASQLDAGDNVHITDSSRVH